MLSAHNMRLEQCFALPGCGSSLGKSKAGAAPDALPGQRRDVVAGSMMQDTFQLGLSSQELPEHTAAQYHVTS